MLQARQNNDEWFSQDVNITCMKIVSKHLMTWEWNSVQRRLKQAMLSKVVPRIENTFRKQESGCNFMFSIPLSCSKILHLQNFILLRLQKHSRCLSENCNAWKPFFDCMIINGLHLFIPNNVGCASMCFSLSHRAYLFIRILFVRIFHQNDFWLHPHGSILVG